MSETLYADAAQLAVAFARLAPGHSILFARGPAVDARNPAAQLVAGWVADKAARRHVSGRDEAGQLRHVVVKLGKGESVNGSASGNSGGSGSASGFRKSEGFRVRIEAAGLEGRTLREAALLAEHLAGVARRGEVCPSNAELADALNLRAHNPDYGRERTKYLLKALIRAQIVSVISRPPHPRVISFVGTRLATADVGGVMDSGRPPAARAFS